jgi:hypothetical protein
VLRSAQYHITEWNALSVNALSVHANLPDGENATSTAVIFDPSDVYVIEFFRIVLLLDSFKIRRAQT